MPTFNQTEQEAIVLNAVWDAINDMVNYEMFVKFDRSTDVVLMFNTATHARLFGILLGDFLSQPQARKGASLPFDLPEPPSQASAADLTYLFYLRELCSRPQLGTNIAPLRGAVEAFATWLEADATVEKVWLPSISLELTMKIKRMLFLKICGDIAKHNFIRLSQNVKRLQQVLASHGHIIDEGQAYSVLPEFYEWFHRDVFIYHSSTIAEFLNNIRLAIFTYLQDEYVRAYHRVEPEPAYRFHIPAAITQPIAREMYWELMNRVRGGPYMTKFEVSKYAKCHY